MHGNAVVEGSSRINRHNGYIYEKCPSHPKTNNTGWVYQHVLIIEKMLGRFLQDDECVHHKNGIKHDNRLENLEVLKIGQHHTMHGLARDYTRKSKYRWVRYHKQTKRWQARVYHKGRELSVLVDTEEQAAKEADRIAFRLHRRKARLNFPDKVLENIYGIDPAY